jgi:hypothetical protein
VAFFAWTIWSGFCPLKNQKIQKLKERKKKQCEIVDSAFTASLSICWQEKEVWDIDVAFLDKIVHM